MNNDCLYTDNTGFSNADTRWYAFPMSPDLSVQVCGRKIDPDGYLVVCVTPDRITFHNYTKAQFEVRFTKV